MAISRGPDGEVRTGVAAENDHEQFLTDRLGPLARFQVQNSPRMLNVAAILKEFQAGRNPIEIDGEFYPAPPYNSPDGDKEFASFIERYLKKATGMTVEDATLIARHRRTR